LNAILAFGRAVLFFLIVVRFRARSAKTNNRKKGKYHAAAGKYQLEATTA
jgi:hypothetical protein